MVGLYPFSWDHMSFTRGIWPDLVLIGFLSFRRYALYKEGAAVGRRASSAFLRTGSGSEVLF